MKPEYIKEYTKDNIFDSLLNLKWLEETQAKNCFDLFYNIAKTHALTGTTWMEITNKKLVDCHKNNSIFRNMLTEAGFKHSLAN